jgi:serine/threonine protein kinase
MGEVWTAVHRRQQLPVAVKVITAVHAQSETARRAFAREVRAMASLVHPKIVLVLDHGPVTKEATLASGGRLVEGCPSFAMELGNCTLTQ